MAQRTEDGDVYLDGAVNVEAGTSGNDFVAGGVISVGTTSVGNTASASNTTLASYVVPANSLVTNGQSIWFEASGQISALTGTVALRASFGGTIFYDYTMTNPAAGFFYFKGRIIRTGASAQKTYGSMVSGPITSLYLFTDYATTALSLASNQTFAVLGQCTTANIITLHTLIVGWDGNNT